MLPAGCDAGQKHHKPPKRAVILVFTAPAWCRPCQQYKPTYEKWKRDGYDVRVYDTDTPEGSQMAKSYGVDELPTTIILKDGKAVHRHVGGMTHDQLIKVLKVVGCVLYTAVKIAIILI